MDTVAAPGPERADASVPVPDLDGDGDGDVVVLAWWQHPLNVVTLLVSTALVAGMIGWLIADSNAGPDPSEVDVGFLQDMREHHEQAIAMSLIYLDLPDTDPGLRTVARSIVFGQGIDIGRMIQMLRDFGETEAAEGDVRMAWMGMSAAPGAQPGMASDDELDALSGAAGRDADELFVELMERHHRAGAHMAEYAAEHADVGEVRAMAAAMAASQLDEIAELRQVLG